MMYPNHIFVSEYKGPASFNPDDHSHFVIVSVGDSKETVRREVANLIGFDVEPVWLFAAVHPILYDQRGDKPLPVQFKVLYNGNFHVSNNKQMGGVKGTFAYLANRKPHET